MTTEASSKLLVVSNPDDSTEIVAELREAGFENIHAGDGGDETLTLFRALAPDVVVMCAGLEHGDARALTAAMRATPEGARARITLIGQQTGPIRNALDAAAFEVDRFVGRPLSRKALAFAVGQCARAVAEDAPREDAGGDGDPGADGPDVPEAPAASGEPDAPRDPDVPGSMQRITRAMDEAIDDFVRDAMETLPASGVPRAAPDAPTAEHLVPGPGAEPERAPASDPGEPAGAVPLSWAEGAADADRPVREPTMVLSGNGASADGGWNPGAGAPGSDPDLGAAEEVALDRSVSDWRGRDSLPGGDLSDSVDDFIESGSLDEELDSHLDDDLDDGVAGPAEPGEPGEPGDPDAGGGFATELRRKMSRMAERLFPEQHGDGSTPVDVGVAHDAHTEIDLASLGVDTVVGHRDEGGALGGDWGASETVSDEETQVRIAGGESTAPSESGRTGTGKVPERGELSDTGADVAAILAEHHRRGFTGHIVFSRGSTEKTVHVHEGRPIFATSNLPHDRMGELLHREGKITRDQHGRCRELVAQSGRRMGEILVEMGYLKRRELLPAVRRHIEDVIYSLFAWDAGEYVAVPEDVASGEKIRLSRDPAAIILEGVRRKHTWPVLEARLGTPDAIVATGARERVDKVLAVADLSAAEKAVVTALGGDRTLGEIAQATGTDLLSIYQLGFGLITLGVAQLIHKGGDSQLGREATRAPSLVGETDLAIDRQRVLAKHALVAEADYFMLLGVRRDATRFEIRRAYEAARREYARDSFPAEVKDELGGEIDEIGDLLDEALGVLLDDDLRQAYLANLRD